VYAGFVLYSIGVCLYVDIGIRAAWHVQNISAVGCLAVAAVPALHRYQEFGTTGGVVGKGWDSDGAKIGAKPAGVVNSIRAIKGLLEILLSTG